MTFERLAAFFLFAPLSSWDLILLDRLSVSLLPAVWADTGRVESTVERSALFAFELGGFGELDR